MKSSISHVTDIPNDYKYFTITILLVPMSLTNTDSHIHFLSALDQQGGLIMNNSNLDVFRSRLGKDYKITTSIKRTNLMTPINHCSLWIYSRCPLPLLLQNFYNN